MIGVIILAESNYLDARNDFLFRFARAMVGARSSTQPPGRIRLGKFGKVFLLPRNCPIYVEI